MTKLAAQKQGPLARIELHTQEGEKIEFLAKLNVASTESRFTFELEPAAKDSEWPPFTRLDVTVSGGMIFSAISRAFDKLASRVRRLEGDRNALSSGNLQDIRSCLAAHMTLLLSQEDDWKATSRYLGTRIVEHSLWDTMRDDDPSTWSHDLLETLWYVDDAEERFRAALEHIQGKECAEELFWALMPHYSDN